MRLGIFSLMNFSDVALVKNNVAVAADIAVELAKFDRQQFPYYHQHQTSAAGPKENKRATRQGPVCMPLF